MRRPLSRTSTCTLFTARYVVTRTGSEFGRELQRVVDEARDDECEALVVSEHALRIGRDGDREAIVVGRFDEPRDHLAEHILEVDRRSLEADLPRLELRDAEQVVGEAGEVLGFEPQLVQALVTRILRKAIARVVHEREPRLDLGQGCPQLVGRQHHELALDAIDLAQLGERGVLELDGSAHLRVALAHQLAREQVAAQRDDEEQEQTRHERVDERACPGGDSRR